MKIKNFFYVVLILMMFSLHCMELLAAPADNDDNIGAVLCNVYDVATGPIGKGAFVVIIIVTSGSFFMGKANVSAMVIICGASGCFFAAPKVAKVLLGSDNDICPENRVRSIFGQGGNPGSPNTP